MGYVATQGLNYGVDFSSGTTITARFADGTTPEQIRQQVVAARQETASLEKLREQKLDGYRKAVQKQEEQFIDELVSASRVTAPPAV